MRVNDSTAEWLHPTARQLLPAPMASATLAVMDDPLPPDLQAVLDHVEQSAQRLAMGVIDYPAGQLAW
jgi:hypothetical protein